MEYVSDELFHFVGRHKPKGKQQFELLKEIFKSGTLISSGKSVNSGEIDPRDKIISGELSEIVALCFCDIPKQLLGIHTGKYSKFGLSFSKRFLASKGAKPVIYIPIKSQTNLGKGARGKEVPKRLRRVLGALLELRSLKGLINQKFPSDRKLREAFGKATNQTQFLVRELYYYIKMFDEDLPQDHAKNYYMEREWRIIGEHNRTKLSFSLKDVQSVMIPTDFRQQLLKAFPSLSNRVIHT